MLFDREPGRIIERVRTEVPGREFAPVAQDEMDLEGRFRAHPVRHQPDEIDARPIPEAEGQLDQKHREEDQDHEPHGSIHRHGSIGDQHRDHGQQIEADRRKEEARDPDKPREERQRAGTVFPLRSIPKRIELKCLRPVQEPAHFALDICFQIQIHFFSFASFLPGIR